MLVAHHVTEPESLEGLVPPPRFPHPAKAVASSEMAKATSIFRKSMPRIYLLPMRLTAFHVRKPLLFPLRVLWHTLRHSLHHHVFTRASALTYTSLLAIVPTLILVHSIAGAFGIFDQALDLLPMLNSQLQLGLPMLQLQPILAKAETLGFGQLGLIGSIGLFVTFVAAMENLETNMNVVWGVKQHRTLARKILVSIPFLFLIGLCIAAVTVVLSYLHHWMQMLSSDGISVLDGGHWLWLRSSGLYITFHALLWGCLYLLYQLMPDTRVHSHLAMLAAAVSLVLMRLLVWAFLGLQIYFFQRMSLFYGSLAFIPLVMLLVEGIWCVVLFGNTLCWRLHHWPPNKLMDPFGENL